MEFSFSFFGWLFSSCVVDVLAREAGVESGRGRRDERGSGKERLCGDCSDSSACPPPPLPPSQKEEEEEEDEEVKGVRQMAQYHSSPFRDAVDASREQWGVSRAESKAGRSFFSVWGVGIFTGLGHVTGTNMPPLESSNGRSGGPRQTDELGAFPPLSPPHDSGLGRVVVVVVVGRVQDDEEGEGWMGYKRSGRGEGR